MDDIVTATGGSITTKTFSLRLGAAAYTTVSNANTLTNSGENLSLFWTVDFTSHFTTNWTGTSMTSDFQVTINQSTGTTLGMVNVCVTLAITYEYDDTSATHIKSVMIPLDMLATAVDTVATTRDTIPALDTYLPEASKTYRNIHVVVQGNTANNGSATDHTMTLRVGAASVTTGNYEAALGTDRYYRYVWDITSAWPATNATQTWQPTATVARCNHSQAYLVVTYEFDPSTTTSVMNSVFLPMEVASPMGGPTSSDYQRATRGLWIQEPGPITTNKIAFYVYWQQIGAIAGLNFRIGTGSFVAYTDTQNVMGGTNAAMVRNDSSFTLARGYNELNFDCYRTDTSDYGWNICGFWLVNYTSGKATAGIGAHNKSIWWGLSQFGTAAAADTITVSATAPIIPENDHFLTALGTETTIVPSGTTAWTGFSLLVERLAAEGGIEWESAYIDVSQNDAEVGANKVFSQVRDLFNRWPTDPEPARMDLETARRWRIVIGASSITFPAWFGLSLVFTYHSITYTVSGTVSSYADADGAGLTVNILRNNSNGLIEHVGSATTTTGGAFTFTWYDNTMSLFATCYEDSTHAGVSLTTVAT